MGIFYRDCKCRSHSMQSSECPGTHGILYQMKNRENIVDLLGLKVFYSHNSCIFFPVVEEPLL